MYNLYMYKHTYTLYICNIHIYYIICIYIFVYTIHIPNIYAYIYIEFPSYVSWVHSKNTLTISLPLRSVCSIELFNFLTKQYNLFILTLAVLFHLWFP